MRNFCGKHETKNGTLECSLRLLRRVSKLLERGFAQLQAFKIEDDEVRDNRDGAATFVCGQRDNIRPTDRMFFSVGLHFRYH